MNKNSVALSAAVSAVLGALLFLPLLGSIFGAFTGFVVGLFFTSSIPTVLAQIGITAPLWKVGATLGFVGGFFRTKVNK